MSDDVVERLRAELKRFEAHGPKECAQNIRDAIAEIDKLRSIYQSAVHGRREMRHALKEERLRAAPTDRAAVVEEVFNALEKAGLIKTDGVFLIGDLATTDWNIAIGEVRRALASPPATDKAA